MTVKVDLLHFTNVRYWVVNYIINSSSGLDQNTSTPQVSVTLDGEGGEIMSQTTKEVLQKPMATLYGEYKTTVKRRKWQNHFREKNEEVINVATIQRSL